MIPSDFNEGDLIEDLGAFVEAGRVVELSVACLIHDPQDVHFNSKDRAQGSTETHGLQSIGKARCLIERNHYIICCFLGIVYSQAFQADYFLGSAFPCLVHD